MFDLAISTCLAGYVCFRTAGEFAYASATDCLRQGAMISGMLAGHSSRGIPFASTVSCTGPDGSVASYDFTRNDGDIRDIPKDQSAIPSLDLETIFAD